MTDTSHPADDAPMSASKHSSAPDDVTATVAEGKGSSVTGRAVTINKPVAEVYGYFRDFSNLPHFMENVESITVMDDVRSHWVVKAPAGRTVEWDARVTAEEADRFIEWTSEEGADVPNSGRVEFTDVPGRGTVVVGTIAYAPPLGVVGKIVAKMFQREPAIQARRDLARLKQLMETGEIATRAVNPKHLEELGR